MYLEYMDKKGQLEKLVEYGKVGRSQYKFRRILITMAAI